MDENTPLTPTEPENVPETIPDGEAEWEKEIEAIPLDSDEAEPEEIESPEGGSDDQNSEDKPTDQQGASETEKPPDDDSIEVILEGKPQKLSRQEAAQLIGRGKAWKEQQQELDKLRKFRQEAEIADGYVKALAQRAGMAVPEYIRLSKVQALVQAGVDEPTARAQVALEEREAKVAVIEAEQKRLADEKAASEAAKKRDFEDFSRAYPDIAAKPEAIPASVWQDTAKGISLTAAYAKHREALLQTELAQYKQQKSNAQRSIGSVETYGTTDKQDEFERWFDSD